MADPRARVINRRGSGLRRSQARVKWVVLLLFAATAVITWQLARRQSGPDLSYSAIKAIPAPTSANQAGESLDYPSRPSSFIRGENRLVYPYSVIPGGIRTLADLKLAMADDPVVAQQYQGFDFQHARLVQVAQKQSMFVAYRLGQKVYWTRKKLALHQGETLVTDGRITARSRCGNRVSAVPLNTGSPMEPPEEAFNQPYGAMIAAPGTDPMKADPGLIPAIPTEIAKNSRRWWVLPLFGAPFAALPHSDSSSSTPLAVTPEPGMSLLLISGLGGVIWRVRKLRRKD